MLKVWWEIFIFLHHFIGNLLLLLEVRDFENQLRFDEVIAMSWWSVLWRQGDPYHVQYFIWSKNIVLNFITVIFSLH